METIKGKYVQFVHAQIRELASNYGKIDVLCLTGERCFACGLRTAVDLFLQGRFAQAYRSNPLIVVVVLSAALMAADVLHYLYRRKKGGGPSKQP